MKREVASVRCCEDARCCRPRPLSKFLLQLQRVRSRLRSSRRVQAALPVIAMLAAAGLWGPSFVATKVALREVPPLTVAFLRFLLASCFLYPLCRISYPGTELNWSDHRRLILGGLVGVTFFFVLENIGVSLTTAGDASILMATIPVICLLAETLWFRKTTNWRRGKGIIVSIIGVCMVIRQAPSSGGEAQVAGDVLVLVATLCWAAYTLLGRALNQYPKLILVSHQTVYGMCMLSPFALSEMGQWQIPSSLACLSILYLGIMCSAITYLLYNYALKELAASQVSTFLNLVPVIGVMSAVFLLDEQIYSIQIVGGAIILVGVAVTTRA